MSAARLLDALLLGLAIALGCSAVVDPIATKPLCEQHDGSPRVCPEGLSCVEGRCVRACTGAEVCRNGIDDDCDNKIDEVDALGRDTCGDKVDNDCDGTVDEGSDFDGDGYTWCGDTLLPGTALDSVDCDDRLASVHPGLPESCDGQDNDCDGKLDEDNAGAALCADGLQCAGRCVALRCTVETECGWGETCDRDSGQCVPMPCGNVSCADDQVCDTATNTCVPRVQMDNGAACQVHADCLSGACIDAQSLRFRDAGRVCGQACCDDSNCPNGQRCFASGSGARSCLPNALIPSDTPSECAADEGCTGAAVCALNRAQSFGPPQYIPRNNVITSNCLNVPIGFRVGSLCAGGPVCLNRVCIPGQTFGYVCSNPCGSSADCQELAAQVGGLGAYCRYIDVTPDAAPSDYAAVCVVRRVNETGAGEYGAECTTSADCVEGGCVDATSQTKGRCTPTCCNDSQCGHGADGKPIHCRPFAFGDRYEMRCEI